MFAVLGYESIDEDTKGRGERSLLYLPYETMPSDGRLIRTVLSATITNSIINASINPWLVYRRKKEGRRKMRCRPAKYDVIGRCQAQPYKSPLRS